jgi:asparagine N-glycosylation enzyme membrane subunit Stt3
MRKIVQYDKKTAILFAIAFLISFFARMYWVDYASNVEEYKFNNQVMINTNDGYFYAEGARDLLAGSHETGDRSAVTEPVAYATMILYKLLPFISFETLILYMPAFFGSLVVIPIILIGRAFEKTEIGFFAAVFVSITYSYN